MNLCCCYPHAHVGTLGACSTADLTDRYVVVVQDRDCRNHTGQTTCDFQDAHVSFFRPGHDCLSHRAQMGDQSQVLAFDSDIFANDADGLGSYTFLYYQYSESLHLSNREKLRFKKLLHDIEEEINISLRNLKTDYVDLWLMHWPYPGCFEQTWDKMMKVYQEGKVRAIGVANYDVRHFKQLLAGNPAVVPMVNQMEYHPLRTARHLKEYMDDNGIVTQAYAPLCRLVPPLKESPILNELAQKYGKSIGQIILRWHVQQGNVMPVFKSYNPKRFVENVDVLDFELTEDEMNSIYSLNQNYKYHIESINCPGY